MRYFIKQKVFSFGDKFTVYDKQEGELFKVEGKMFSIKNKLEFKDLSGNILFRAERKVLSFLPEYSIYNAEGLHLATVKKKFTFFRHSFQVIEGNNDIQVQGDFLSHNFNIVKNGQLAASIQKKLFSWGDTYMIDVSDESASLLYLFITIVIDQVAHENERKSVNFD